MACLQPRLFKILWQISNLPRLLLAIRFFSSLIGLQVKLSRVMTLCRGSVFIGLFTLNVFAQPLEEPLHFQAPTLIAEAGTWVAVLDKQALVCQLVDLASCLRNLPLSLQHQTALSAINIRQSMGLKSAMVLVVEHESIAGIIIVQAEREPKSQTGSLGLNTYGIELVNQAQLSLWHELGHLHTIGLQGKVLPIILSDYQHEWLADVYVFWRLGQTKQLHLAWQQLHRRNLAVIHDSDNLSHWSAPQLQFLLQQYDQHILATEVNYVDFITEVYPRLPNYSDRDMAEFSSLIQRTFGAGVVQPLPNYMFWRQPSLAAILQPTLSYLMGENAAQTWLSQHFIPAYNL